MKKNILLILFVPLLCPVASYSQEEEASKAASLTLFTGLMNYQGDLNPNSFTFRNSNFSVGLLVKKPITNWLNLRVGIHAGTIEAADRNNRNYLKQRNLSFYTSIKEAHAGLELLLLNPEKSKVIPYVYGGIAVFKFNPWTYDNTGTKTFLQPLGTEGQGIYPGNNPYSLTQLSLPFGGGIKYAITDAINVGIEFSQRKSFTDHLDDVSGSYADVDDLIQARGPKAVELAYRGDEIPGGSPTFPAHGEQRGTPSEMDWYYHFGTTIEIKLNSIRDIFRGRSTLHGAYNLRCPRNVTY